MGSSLDCLHIDENLLDFAGCWCETPAVFRFDLVLGRGFTHSCAGRGAGGVVKINGFSQLMDERLLLPRPTRPSPPLW